MLCPLKWTDCDSCNNKQKCIDGMFTPEEDREPIIKAAELAEVSTQAEAVQGAKRLRGRIRLESFWTEWGKYRPPNLHSKEPMPAGQGTPGGGGHCKVPPKPPYKMPEYLKNWGQVN